MILNKYRILIDADQRLYIEAKFQTQGILLNLLFSVVLIKFHSPVLLVQLVAAIVYTIRAFRIRNYVKREYPQASFNEKVSLSIIPNVKSASSYQVSNIIISYTPILLITFIIGLKEVSVYSIYNMVFASLLMIINVFSTGLSSAFGNIYLKKDKILLNRNVSTYTFLFYSIGFTLYACAYKLILPFINIYTSGIDDINYDQPLLALLFIINGIIAVIRTPALTMVEASGMYRENAVLNIGEAVLNIIISIILTYKLGLVGVLMGSAIVGSLRTIIYLFFLYSKVVTVSIYKVAMIIISNIFIIKLIKAIPIQISNNSFIDWIGEAIVVFLMSFLLIFTINSIIDKESFIDILKKIKIIFKKIMYKK